MRKGKSQSALEYLSIYGVAIFIIIAAAAALYFLGVYSPQNNFMGTCTFSEGFSCSNMKLASTGVLQFNLVNAGQYPIYVSGLGCNTNRSIINIVNTTGPNNNTVYIPTGSSHTFTVQCYRETGQFSEGVGTSFTGYLVVNYTDQYTETKATSLGSLSTKVISGTASSTTFTTSSTSTSTSSTSTTSTSTTTTSTTTSTSSTSTSTTTSTSTSTSTTTTAIYVYCVGANGGGSTAVYGAPISSTGTGTWTATTQYPSSQTSQAQACVLYSGYVYCTAGDGYGTLSYYAPVSSTGIGTWTSTTSYPVGVYGQACVAYSGDMYCVGARGGSGDPARNWVYYAPISSTGIGAWSSTTGYPQSVYFPMCSTANGYIYCVGGWTQSVDIQNVYYAKLSSTGVGAWTAGSSYPITIESGSCPILNGYIYCVSGWTGGTTTTALVYYAPLSTTGVGSWTAGTSYPLGVYSHECAAYNGYIYCAAGHTNSAYTSDAYYAPASGSVGSWTATSSYPAAETLYNNCVTVT